MHLFDHKFGEMCQHIGKVIRLRASPGRYVIEKWLLTHIELDDFWHIGINRLIVGNARPRGVGKHNRATAIGIEKPRCAKQTVWVEGQWIKELIINPTVDYIHWRGALGSTDYNTAVTHLEVRTLKQVNTHLVSQKGMFVIGGIMDPWGEHGDIRVIHK